MWQRNKPWRSSGEISQNYNDGTVTIYSASDSAVAGHQPVTALSRKGKLLYEERALGITRIYQSRQAMAEIERVIRVQRRPISVQDVAVTEDGAQYRIETVQAAPGVWPESLDLGLRKVETKFEGL